MQSVKEKLRRVLSPLTATTKRRRILVGVSTGLGLVLVALAVYLIWFLPHGLSEPLTTQRDRGVEVVKLLQDQTATLNGATKGESTSAFRESRNQAHSVVEEASALSKEGRVKDGSYAAGLRTAKSLESLEQSALAAQRILGTLVRAKAGLDRFKDVEQPSYSKGTALNDLGNLATTSGSKVARMSRFQRACLDDLEQVASAIETKAVAEGADPDLVREDLAGLRSAVTESRPEAVNAASRVRQTTRSIGHVTLDRAEEITPDGPYGTLGTSSIGPVQIAMNQEQVTELFGPPSTTADVNFGGGPAPQTDWSWTIGDGNVTLSFDNYTGELTNYSTTSSSLATVSGVSVGDSPATLRARYGDQLTSPTVGIAGNSFVISEGSPGTYPALTFIVYGAGIETISGGMMLGAAGE